MKLFAVDGNRQHLDGGAMFGHTPKALWSKWIAPDENNLIPLATRALLVQSEGRNTLFETGIGNFFSPEMKKRYGVTPDHHVLLENLEKIGIPEEKIDAVVLSHLHFDHAGGLLSQEGLHFPNATYYVGKEHFEYAKNPHPRERASFIPHLQPLLQASGRLVLIEGKELFNFKFHISHGHTIGMLLAEIPTPEGPLIFVSDLIPGNAWVNLPTIMGYDRFAELKVDEKKQLYQARPGARLFFTHDPTLISASLKQDDKGRYFGEPVGI